MSESALPYTVELSDLALSDIEATILSMERSDKTTASYIDRFKGSIATSLALLADAPYIGVGYALVPERAGQETISKMLELRIDERWFFPNSPLHEGFIPETQLSVRLRFSKTQMCDIKSQAR